MASEPSVKIIGAGRKANAAAELAELEALLPERVEASRSKPKLVIDPFNTEKDREDV